MDKIVVITGANSGIGKAAAHRFAVEGCTVVMACRSQDKATSAREEIVSASGNEDVCVMALDMSSQRSIRAFVEAFQTTYPRLDVLINNAAYFAHGDTFRLSVDHVELAFATNVAGPYLLTYLLRDSLEQASDPRVLNAGSNIIKHFFNPKKALGFAHLRGASAGTKPPAVYERYCQSKMALLMLTFVLARKFEDADIAVNCIQINGAKMSKETLRKFSWRYRLIAYIQNLFFPPPEFMAANYFEITTSDHFRGVTGKNINDQLEFMKPADNAAGFLQRLRQVAGKNYYPHYAEDVAIQEKIWSTCEALNRQGA